jgi:UDP-N-acetylglucosamine diphosphorylase / glucose-1-phosphate thymidylyltransferase / UDP-N-acetylgalactosamine diphosphorylase / glucosamine-1-phosphate N-acetyltransferase / galactosamine-1-phosphate N-acetyltransferase
MNVVIPMAGRGSRFAEQGISLPKPLIPVRGKPMYAWAVDGLPLSLARRLIFICLSEHLQRHGLEEEIRSRYGSTRTEVIGLEAVTGGQACSVLAARSLIESTEPLLIYNADTYCETGLLERLPSLPAEVRGLLGVFQAAGDRWSFARVDDAGRVLETAEKRRIGEWATTGLYWFREGREFVMRTEEMIAAEERVNGEFYVAPVYNRMIAAGEEVRIDVAKEVWVLGTPEDLAHFDANYPASGPGEAKAEPPKTERER